MVVNGKILCDFCFEPIDPTKPCPKCGLTYDNYHPEIGTLSVGTPLLHGNYVIGRVLGRGGFGVTYLAYSFERGEPVAIKEYFPTGIAMRGANNSLEPISAEKRDTFGKGAKRFYEEAETMSHFNGRRNIVSVYEFFYDNATVYYAMEYLEGCGLKDYIRMNGGRLSVPQAVRIMRAICDALQTVHGMNTLHRDVSPDNIFICNNGDIKLIDFGSAKQLISNAQQNYSVVVTQGFAPIEQYNSDGNQGTWTDLYSLGASIYYTVTGKLPPDALKRYENPTLYFDPTLNISPDFIALIDRCMAFKIENRYLTAGQLKIALDQLPIREADSVSPNPVPNPMPPNPMPPDPVPPNPMPIPPVPDPYSGQAKKEKDPTKLIIGIASLIVVAFMVLLIVVVIRKRTPPTPPNVDRNGGEPPFDQRMNDPRQGGQGDPNNRGA